MVLKKLAKAGAIGLGGLLLLAGWGLIEPRFLDTENEVAEIDNLPSAWEGKQIAQLSDFQFGLWLDNPGTARRAAEQLVETRPAAVLISGDFIYHAMPDPAQEINTAIDAIRPLLEADIPIYAVLGNHDYGMDSKKAEPNVDLANQLETALVEAGVTVLENEAVELSSPEADEEAPLYLVGVGSLWAGRDDVESALASVPGDAARIVMMHNPDSFEKVPANTAPLTVAGHTHGGQMRIPNTPEWSWLRLTQPDAVNADGWARGYGEPGNQLYVNVGIGMSIVPMRLFCPPEVTLFTLESA